MRVAIGQWPVFVPCCSDRWVHQLAGCMVDAAGRRLWKTVPCLVVGRRVAFPLQLRLSSVVVLRWRRRVLAAAA